MCCGKSPHTAHGLQLQAALSIQRSTPAPRLHRAPSPLIAHHPEKVFFSLLEASDTPASLHPVISQLSPMASVTQAQESSTTRDKGSRMKARLITAPSLIQRDGKGKGQSKTHPLVRTGVLHSQAQPVCNDSLL